MIVVAFFFSFLFFFFFFFNDTATTEIYTLSLHDALPISFPPKSPRIRNRAPHRRPRIRRAPYARNASLESGRRPHRLNALERKSPRLSLFPRAGSSPRSPERSLAQRSSSLAPRTPRSQAHSLRLCLRHHPLRC